LIELRFYVSLDTQQFISQTSPGFFPSSRRKAISERHVKCASFLSILGFL